MRNTLFASFFISLFFPFSALGLKVGVTPGPHADIVHQVKKIGEKEGLRIEIVEFNDFILPNEALNASDLDINSFQHEPYLDEQIKTRGYKLKSIAKTVTMPLGLYSVKIKSLDAISDGARIIIPNDPTNGGRALKLLAQNNILNVKDVPNPTILDITSNPKNLSFVEMEAALIPRSLPDAEAAIINTDWALQAGIDPKSALIRESRDSPYVNVIAARTEDSNKEDILKFVKLYQSEEIKDFIEKTYKGAVIPAW